MTRDAIGLEEITNAFYGVVREIHQFNSNIFKNNKEAKIVYFVALAALALFSGSFLLKSSATCLIGIEIYFLCNKQNSFEKVIEDGFSWLERAFSKI